jgi:hypothetical protein
VPYKFCSFGKWSVPVILFVWAVKLVGGFIIPPWKYRVVNVTVHIAIIVIMGIIGRIISIIK